MLHQVDCTFDHAHPSDDPAKVEFALIDRAEDFEALAGQWRALAARAARPHQIFQCHSWLASWCAHYHDPGNLGTDQPAIVVAYRDAALILALPLIVRRVSVSGCSSGWACRSASTVMCWSMSTRRLGT